MFPSASGDSKRNCFRRWIVGGGIMKKIILSLFTIAVLGVITVWVIGSSRQKEAAQREWPGNLGTLDQVPHRYPAAEQSAGATRLVQLASGARIDLKPRVKNDISR